MMYEVFLKMLNMSISGSWLIAAVIVLRLLLKKAPRRFTVFLWGIVAIRLICPLSIESPLSLIPSAETIPQNILMGESFNIHTGIALVDRQMNTLLGSRYSDVTSDFGKNGMKIISFLCIVWLIGVLIIVFYTVFSYWRLHCRLETAVVLRDNIFQSENATMPFVLGLIRPRIYVPFKMNEISMEYIICHEQTHIRRGDHYWKFIGVVLVALHWFNPMVWVAYMLLCRDIELACDESVIRDLTDKQKADYLQTLVACSIRNSRWAMIPLAFGEIGVRNRIKSVMKYKKPVFGVIIAAAAVCVITAVCFLSDPLQNHLPEPKENTEEDLSTPYVGNAVIVSQIAQQLSYPDGYSYASLELQTDSEPYEMIVYLRGNGSAANVEFEECAKKSFELIGNLGVFTVRDSQSGEELASFFRGDLR